MARLTVAVLKDMLGLEFAAVRGEIQAVRDQLQGQIDGLRSDMNRRFDRVDDRFDELRDELRSEFNTGFTELKSLIRANVKRRKR